MDFSNFANDIFLAIAFLFLALIVFHLFSAPVRLAVKLISNTLLGFLALIVLDLLNPLVHLEITVNFINALVVGILGFPGLLLLVLLHWIFLL